MGDTKWGKRRLEFLVFGFWVSVFQLQLQRPTMISHGKILVLAAVLSCFAVSIARGHSDSDSFVNVPLDTHPDQPPDDPRDLLKYKHFMRNLFKHFPKFVSFKNARKGPSYKVCSTNRDALKNIPYNDIKGLWREDLGKNPTAFIDIFDDTIGDSPIQSPVLLGWTQAMRAYDIGLDHDDEIPWYNKLSHSTRYEPWPPAGSGESLVCLFVGHINPNARTMDRQKKNPIAILLEALFVEMAPIE